MNKLTKSALLVALAFGLNKILAIARQIIVLRIFGLSAEMDVFNVANNIPDLLYALISGGALAMALIPVLSEVIAREGRASAWRVFNSVANVAFILTAVFSVVVALLAGLLVRGALGIAPGFNPEQQNLVINLMRLNLIATLIFSMAGLLIAGLQANKHFLLPAVAPILYNIGQIFGAVILAPSEPVRIGSLTLPAFGMGAYGLVYGVLLGSVLFFLLQIPALIAHQYRWHPILDLKNHDAQKILSMLGPRVAGMFFYQLTFIARDNIASHLPIGSITALTNGWMILQVPETIIGTALGTVLLPSIAEQFSTHKLKEFRETIITSARVLIALALPAAIVLIAAIPPFLAFASQVGSADFETLTWVTRAFLLGLTGHCLLELSTRIFYAQQNAVIPMLAAGLNLILFSSVGWLLSARLAASGLALADAIAFTSQALILFFLFFRNKNKIINKESGSNGYLPIINTILRSLAGGAGGALVFIIVTRVFGGLPELIIASIGAILGFISALIWVLPELRAFMRIQEN